MTNNSSDLSSFMHDNEFVELLWENGQIVLQGQSNRHRKSLFTNTASSVHLTKAQDKDGGPRVGRFEALDSVVNNDLPPSVPSGIGLNTPQDDDITPWMNYAIEDTLQNDFCAEFLSEFSGVDLNSLNANNTGFGLGNGWNSQNVVEHGHVARGVIGGGLEPGRIRTSQSFHLPQQCQTSLPVSKSRVGEFGDFGSTSTQQGHCSDILHTRPQKQDLSSSEPPRLGSGLGGLMNFSHFSRPVSVLKPNLQCTDRLRSNDKASTAGGSGPVESTLISSTTGVRNVSVTQSKPAAVTHDVVLRSSKNASLDGRASVRQSIPIHQEEALKNNKDNTNPNKITRPPDHSNHQATSIATALGGKHAIEKAPEAVVASSVCSGNNAGSASNDPKPGSKRKSQEGEEAEYQSEDVEDESVGLRKPPPARGTSAKRSRAAEVHNLSERRRRDRINERMRTLQELIPNCNKVDKASMLDEAIEYLKTLQLQVQIMSMGSGLCIPPMMLPPGMQHIRAPPMGPYSTMGMGMGMGMGYGMGMLDMNGSAACPLIPQFPCTSLPGAPGLHGMPGSSSLQMFGIPGQGFPVPMPRSPQCASFSVLSGKPNIVPEVSGAEISPVSVPVADTVPSPNSKDQHHQILIVDAPRKTSVDNSQIPASVKADNECVEHSTLVRMSDQFSGNGSIKSLRKME